MPKVSNQHRLLQQLKDDNNGCFWQQIEWELMIGRRSSIWHDLSTHKFCCYVEATKMHYISCRTCQKVSHKIFHKILYGDPAHPEDFDSFQFQTKFSFHYCMDHLSFWRLHQLVKEHLIFMSPQHSWQVQAPSEFQLLVLLKYLGSQGIATSNTSLTSHFSNFHWYHWEIQEKSCPSSIVTWGKFVSLIKSFGTQNNVNCYPKEVVFPQLCWFHGWHYIAFRI